MSMFSEKHPPQKKHQLYNRPNGLPTVQDRRRSGLHFCIGSLDSTSSSWHCRTSSLDDSTDGRSWKDASHDHPWWVRCVQSGGSKRCQNLPPHVSDTFNFRYVNVWWEKDMTIYYYFHEGFLFPWPIVASWQLCVRFGVLFDRYTSVKSKNLGYEKPIHQNCAIDWTAMVSMNSTKKVPNFWR